LKRWTELHTRYAKLSKRYWYIVNHVQSLRLKPDEITKSWAELDAQFDELAAAIVALISHTAGQTADRLGPALQSHCSRMRRRPTLVITFRYHADLSYLTAKSIREYEAKFWRVSLNRAPGYSLSVDSIRSLLTNQTK